MLAASPLKVTMDALELPTDVVPNKLIVSYHAYEPGAFCFDKSPVDTWSQSNPADTKPITDPIDRYYDKFVRNGTPVIIGESGASNKNNESTVAKWAEFYVSYAASKGLKCLYWMDLLNRKTNTFLFPQVKDALIRGAENTIPSPNNITGNMGQYAFGKQDGSDKPNYQLAVWENVSAANMTTAQSAGAQLVLELHAAPSSSMNLIWQGPNNDIRMLQMTFRRGTKLQQAQKAIFI